ncbi:hypothetical protein [Spiroplasma ixodetis]|uniref:hypothetical protein n=1 Tax=Spiroplasma ixodetis TaxID=2141 RepID=UPI0025757CB1|nr:hypothetical protein [Spiroplasma ixodetis]WJG71462.1 hypothetical protein SIXOD_v1c29130 [Spiroplasma ixodetis Y32]
MQKFLVTLSIVIIGVNSNIISGNNIYLHANNNLLTQKSLLDKEPTTSLFNNQYGYLSDNDWITNQSKLNSQYYSYDTSALKPYTFSNARNVFLVDNTGTLVYNPAVTIPDKDKADIENTKQEMISNRKINKIKNHYKYSNSEYSESYFSNNSGWKYLQMGGLEKHIDISQQAGAEKVEYNNNLSESLGLHYIAKAARENKISLSIAYNLGKYFISQSSLKKNNIDDLINVILDIIVTKYDSVYKFINTLPFGNDDKNYSMNYIFDDKQNLIEINYEKFDNKDIEKPINYSFNDWYSGFNSQKEDSSNVYTLLKWSDYTKDWDTFCSIFSNFYFDKNSFLKVSASYGETDAAKLVSKTKNIKTYQEKENNNSIFTVNLNWGSWYIGNQIRVDFNIWHDNENIYFKWFLQENSHWAYNLYVNIFLKNVLFEI